MCVYWFCTVFLDGESKYFKRKVAETQSFFFFFTNTECTKETKAFFAEAQQAKASPFILCLPCSCL